ncbi:dATP/dGTP diphosphohydrolase domain-containing protein [Acidithiobacillus albertensis]|uniref:dATP/dGTP diphosphohydrolase domain-containing protein n=1 Tax=Acidithiobacillus albertensis TaxID=119978 RepID=UPI000980DA5E|nr:dATP/dGTP diphosphohydrolase domain-containing protein [Acidithiobacillus albertensis]
MEIEEGKRYMRRDGRKTGALMRCGSKNYPFLDPYTRDTYTCSGEQYAGVMRPADLISGLYDSEGEDSEYQPKTAEPAAWPTEAIKQDQGKPRYDLLPGDALDQIAQVLTYGATKYSPRNWESGMAWGRLYAALMRHCWAFWRGEDTDSETGMHHMAHAGACILLLLASVGRGIGTDDRRE